MIPDPSMRRRSVTKAISWETISTVVQFGLAYAMFGSVNMCIAFAFISFVVKLVMFYYHERVWHQIPWGKRT